MQSTERTLPNLSLAVTRQVLRMLRDALLASESETPEEREERLDVAMGEVASYCPTDIAQAMLAAEIVATRAHAMDALSHAAIPGQDFAIKSRCRAQASAMLRLSHGAKSSLERTQARWEKAEREMQPAAMERAGYWWHDSSVPEAAPAEAPVEVAAPVPAVERKPEFADLTEAEQYAVLYPDRAARIREFGGLPPRCSFGPPEPELIEALIRGDSPILREVDHHVHRMLARV